MATSSIESDLLARNPFQTSGTVIRKVIQGHHRAVAPAKDHHLALNARRYRWTTAPQLACDLADVSGRRISRQTVYRSLLAFMPSVQFFQSL
ncbi:hypothetical protein TNCV_4907631 [Trichonephila clavipes]|uniref:Uncharacterized protein n=1 Tax=Trichonephila clavipes TaxID=2585209 RepID=A0A8X6RX82_TRICX|nr:hypothetical protein TNCV_4907631 [Trichonephila clavipes]